MAHLWTTGNGDIDSATAEIAVALRNACNYTCGDQDHYDEAMRLRNRIMAGTRAMDAESAPKPFPFTHGSDEAQAAGR